MLLWCQAGACYVHNFGETGNAKHVINLVGDIRDSKTILTEGSTAYQAKSQKGGGNVHDFGEIKGQSDIITIISEI
jgi:hypothetical protein